MGEGEKGVRWAFQKHQTITFQKVFQGQMITELILMIVRATARTFENVTILRSFSSEEAFQERLQDFEVQIDEIYSTIFRSEEASLVAVQRSE